MYTTPSARDRHSIALASPQSIAAALPHLMGFHPRESLLCLWTHGGTLVVVQRADLPEAACGDGGSEFVCAYLEAARNVTCDEAVFVCVTKRVALAHALLQQLADACSVPVRALLLINGSRVTDVGGDNRWAWVGTSERQEASLAFDTPQLSVRRDRGDLEAELAFDAAAAWNLPEGVPAPTHADALLTFLDARDFHNPKRCRALRDMTLSVQGRDLVMWWCARQRVAERHSLLAALIVGLRATTPEGSANLACATAAVAWMTGDGVRANIAVDRCLAEHPGHVMARMVESAMSAALAPSVFANMLLEVEPAVLGLSAAAVDASPEPGYSPA